jgi:hypothetical protein
MRDNFMKCYECGNETIIRNDYHIDDEYIGQYVVKCEYNYCENCNSEYIPFDSLEILETFENNKKIELLKKNFPIETNEYLTVEEIAKLENKSANQILLDKRFNIWVYHYDTEYGRIYLKESYDKHKLTGNIGFLKLFS